MKNIIRLSGCILVAAFCSCSNSSTNSSYTRCEDSLAMFTKPAATATTTATATGADSIVGTNDSISSSLGMNDNTDRESEAANIANTKKHGHHKVARITNMYPEPTSSWVLKVTSDAFKNGGVIPVKYTCDGEGATPPLNVTNIPAGAKSLALIVYDYNANENGGYTYWLIWNLDTYGIIPENFSNSHETINAAKQYGYTPLCPQSGGHKYHFIVYALDCKLLLGKNTTKRLIEKTMMGHILGKGEIVGKYDKHVE